MEQFFSNNPYALYFIGLLFLIISNKSNKKSEIDGNIILIYIIFSLVNIFNIIDLLSNIIVILLICFIELQILNLSNETLIVKSRYKIYDYIFTMINKYKIANILIENIIIKIIYNIEMNNVIIKIIILIIYGIFLIYTISQIYRNSFKVKEFKTIENIFNKKAEGFNYGYTYDIDEKINMLIDIEDKTYFFRKKSYSSISIESLMCKIGREQEYEKIINNIKKYNITYFFINCKLIFKYMKKILTTIIKAILYKNGIKRFIKRGYSTIEMQWIRNVGIEIGYEKVYRRKIFELIYSNIFFRSLQEKRKYYTYPEYFYDNPEELYKKLIVYVYLKTVPTFIYKNNMRVKVSNIYEFYELIRNKENNDNKNILNEFTKEEIFIFIMGLSGKTIDNKLYDLYEWYILKYNINIKEVEKILGKMKLE